MSEVETIPEADRTALRVRQFDELTVLEKALHAPTPEMVKRGARTLTGGRKKE